MKESEIDTTTFPQLFAYDGVAAMNLVGSIESGFTYRSGIPTTYAVRTGKKVVRGDMNGLGRLITQSGFFNQLGGYYTFDSSVSDAIGGYPLGAVLSYKDENGYIRKVRSLIGDNTYNFVENPEYIDDEKWSFVDQIVPVGCRPRIFPEYSEQFGGTLSISSSSSVSSSQFTTPRDCLCIMQTGPDNVNDTCDGNTIVCVWASVKRDGEDRFSAAAMIGAIPPVGSAYIVNGSAAQYVAASLEKVSHYTAFYSSSPIQIYLKAGDTVRLESNREFAFSVQYICYPLKA